ncbi:hypothetical protein EJ04DRAFT_484803 [Polyplosphaeria fusca]|uniref:Uncharacterized protein n=1 Tax=Polyplosphaeria fusca TaxID=682080 RepID=A0A9P4V7F0_9PLEO|nr:hypothetical protein EJ04DRAFT_484803 [Polyplosphaeria fusca]
MSATHQSEHWVSRYASGYHTWNRSNIDGQDVYRRPIGLVETSFDLDGTGYGGRADMNALLTLEIRHILSKEELRRRIILAWTSLRLQHTMLMSRTWDDEETGNRNFVVHLHTNKEAVIEEAAKNTVWVEDIYSIVDTAEIHRHCQNVARVLDPSLCLARLHVLPFEQLPNGNFNLRFLLIMAHQISDGLSSYNWFSHWIRILNMPLEELERDIVFFSSEENIASRLPPAQEDMYPPIAGSRARQRWYWAIQRVLRHVRKTLPPAFVNPLRRDERLLKAIAFPPKFEKLFDYSEAKRPPMNSFHCRATLSKSASDRLIDICRSANVSIGAGCFALAGISMMELHEARYPDIPDSERLPFVASFPLNPRTFFGWKGQADSCMLAFSDGITMPFLPSSLPIAGRLRLVARQANRQLRMYQKRLMQGEVNSSLGSVNPQGAYPAAMNMTGATCGVSSVGSTSAFFKPGMVDMNDLGAVKGKDFVADFRALRMGVRARDNEFLIGSSTDAQGIVGFGVSYDGNAISEEAAEAWAEKIKGLLEQKDRAAKL